MIIHLIDGTYELFRHFYGQRRWNKGKDKPFGAVVGVLNGVLQMIEDAAVDAGVPLSCNLSGQIFVNQSAAFSDYHVSGCNPSGNATLTDAAFVAPRFRVVQTRIPVPQSAPAASSAQPMGAAR